jgi:hypothetical protein
MALGGGTWLTQNKILPGTYINFVGVQRATAALSDRGFAALPYSGDWGADGKVVEVTSGEFQTACRDIFGYDYTDERVKPFRDLFKNALVCYFYRLNGGGTAAFNAFATAVCTGTRGNDLKVVIGANVDDDALFDVSLYLGAATLDKQTVANAAGLKNNAYVNWKPGATLAATAGTPLAGGVSAGVENQNYSNFLEAIEEYSFNTLCCPSGNNIVKGLFAAFTKRLRDEQGVKFQTVIHNYPADYEGVVNVKNNAAGAGASGTELVYWVTGAQAGCAVNKSALNKIYDGEYEVELGLTQRQLEAAIKAGEFTFHRVGSDTRVLYDINSLTSLTLEKTKDFQQNQTIRVLDQIGNDIAVLFNTKYLGVFPNDQAGRESLWADIVFYNQQLQDLRAIQDFVPEDVTVAQGGDKNAVAVSETVSVVNAMAKLYMTCYVA